ncbi:MAG: hypothetical protein AAF572_18375 [Cyanobacteria bacterium P01_B01_bin.77]
MSLFSSSKTKCLLISLSLAAVGIGAVVGPANAAQFRSARAYSSGRNLNIDVRLRNEAGGTNDSLIVTLWRDRVRRSNRFKKINIVNEPGVHVPIHYDHASASVSIHNVKAGQTFEGPSCYYPGRMNLTITDGDRFGQPDSFSLTFAPNRQRRKRGCPKPKVVRMNRPINDLPGVSIQTH